MNFKYILHLLFPTTILVGSILGLWEVIHLMNSHLPKGTEEGTAQGAAIFSIFCAIGIIIGIYGLIDVIKRPYVYNYKYKDNIKLK